MQFNDAFAQVIQVKSNAAAIKQLKRNLSRDLIPDFCRWLEFPRMLACQYLRFRISLAVQFIRGEKYLADIWSSNNTAPDKSEYRIGRPRLKLLYFHGSSLLQGIIIIRRQLSRMLIGAIAHYDDCTG